MREKARGKKQNGKGFALGCSTVAKAFATLHWCLEPLKCLGIRAATRAAPTKTGLLDLQIARFYVYDVGATLVVAQISKVPDTNAPHLTLLSIANAM